MERKSSKKLAKVAKTKVLAVPLYMKIAHKLTAEITAGTYQVGAHLPTELELCEEYGISRHTAREAIRVLLASGLITRRQRVGTVVIARPDEARFTLDVMSLRGLLQYAQETDLRLMFVGKITLTKQNAIDYGAPEGSDWTYAVGLRVDAKESASKKQSIRPICLSRVYINSDFKGIESKLRERKGAIHALIEREYHRPIKTVDQEIQAVVLGADAAANLHVESGSPALRIIRRYFDTTGQLLEIGDNLHPSDRFSYRMQMQK